jgi:hypothetical protein
MNFKEGEIKPESAIQQKQYFYIGMTEQDKIEDRVDNQHAVIKQFGSPKVVNWWVCPNNQCELEMIKATLSSSYSLNKINGKECSSKCIVYIIRYDTVDKKKREEWLSF